MFTIHFCAPCNVYYIYYMCVCMCLCARARYLPYLYFLLQDRYRDMDMQLIINVQFAPNSTPNHVSVLHSWFRFDFWFILIVSPDDRGPFLQYGPPLPVDEHLRGPVTKGGWQQTDQTISPWTKFQWSGNFSGLPETTWDSGMLRAESKLRSDQSEGLCPVCTLCASGNFSQCAELWWALFQKTHGMYRRCKMQTHVYAFLDWAVVRSLSLPEVGRDT
jgi:hypothetical protein